jgi:hypothetical protein
MLDLSLFSSNFGAISFARPTALIYTVVPERPAPPRQQKGRGEPRPGYNY